MRVWAYTLAYNEQIMIPYWVRHYRTFCERVTVYVDHDTDDRTAQLAEAEGALVRLYHGNGSLDDLEFVNFAEQTYPEARGHAEWVIWTDVDEIIYHRIGMGRRLEQLRAAGITLPRTTGWSMLSEHPPTTQGQIYDEISRGIAAPAYAKVAVFDPELEMRWTAGKHDASVVGNLVRDDGADALKVLHYRWLGAEWFRERNERNFARINERNRNALHGRECYPGYTGIYSPAWYEGQLELARPCV